MIDATRTLVLCFEYGGWTDEGRRRWLPILPAMARWVAATFPAENIRRINAGPVDCARNRAVRDVVLPRAAGFDWVLSIDNDVSPTHPGLRHFLDADGDVVACRSFLGDPAAWEDPAAFHCTFYRARVEVFRTLQPPWFRFAHSPDGCELTGCECEHFARQAVAAGFTVAHAGYCGHTPHGSWCYHSGRGDEYAMAHPSGPIDPTANRRPPPPEQTPRPVGP